MIGQEKLGKGCIVIIFVFIFISRFFVLVRRILITFLVIGRNFRMLGAGVFA